MKSNDLKLIETIYLTNKCNQEDIKKKQVSYSCLPSPFPSRFSFLFISGVSVNIHNRETTLK